MHKTAPVQYLSCNARCHFVCVCVSVEFLQVGVVSYSIQRLEQGDKRYSIGLSQMNSKE